MRATLLFIFLTTRAIFAAEVVRVGASQTIIAVTHEIQRKWQVQDPLCIYQDGKELACGAVVKVSEQVALMKLSAPSDLVARGQVVKLQTSEKPYSPQRKPSAILMQSVPKEREANVFMNNLSGGFSVGNGFYFPLLHFQRSVSPQVAIGVMPSYFNVSTGSGSLSAMAGALTVNFYGHEYFRGLWLQGGMGASLLSSTTAAGEQQSTSILSFGTVGWRGYWDLGFNIGVCAGIQYLKDPAFSSIRLSGAGVQPMALVDLGFNF